MAKFLSPQEAAALVKDGDTLITEGFLLHALAEQVIKALGERFAQTGSPTGLTLVYAAGQGGGVGTGLDFLAHEKLLKRVVAGHWNLSPTLGKLATEGKIEAYNLPQGTIAQLYRDMAAGKPGTVTHVGLKTFVDPRLNGGKLNDITKEDLVELVTLGGKELLFYKDCKPTVCFLRGSLADEKGNITMEEEGISLGVLSIAQAVKRNGGKVIVQVRQVVKAGSLDPKLVKIPYICVDAVVAVPHDLHQADVPRDFVTVFSGDRRIPTGSIPPIELDDRKIIARRGAMDLTPDSVVNLGIGIPEAVSAVANEEGIGDYMTLTVEAGPVGGVPQGGKNFGVTINADCILDQAYQFDFYDGGGLDIAYLGLAECDEKGNINVSKMGPRITGCGGFINITQNAKKLYFCGTFTAKGLDIAVNNGKLVIKQEGSVKKFLKKVGHVTFSGEYASQIGQPVYYLTERAVFQLKKDGLHLVEVAPGIDIDKDILNHMEFRPIIDGQPKLMDARIFRDAPMGLGKGR
ncbi:MAG: 3-oxoacid CoA-transferase [Deltaproteobacteria bacterium]|jgi:propionate CoA-transferase|nr:3-oxoacid CoA-transferase [Deltaproteobacteria bacterium]